MKEISTQITINASAERVWSVLMDFNAYPDWNPFVTTILGAAKVGEQLEVTINPPGKKPMVFKPIVNKVIPETLFQWTGRLLIPGVFNGAHRFEIAPAVEGITFTHAEQFSGVLVQPIFSMIATSTQQGFELMNQALKKVCESNQ